MHTRAALRISGERLLCVCRLRPRVCPGVVRHRPRSTEGRPGRSCRSCRTPRSTVAKDVSSQDCSTPSMNALPVRGPVRVLIAEHVIGVHVGATDGRGRSGELRSSNRYGPCPPSSGRGLHRRVFATVHQRVVECAARPRIGPPSTRTSSACPPAPGGWAGLVPMTSKPVMPSRPVRKAILRERSFDDRTEVVDRFHSAFAQRCEIRRCQLVEGIRAKYLPPPERSARPRRRSHRCHARSTHPRGCSDRSAATLRSCGSGVVESGNSTGERRDRCTRDDQRTQSGRGGTGDSVRHPDRIGPQSGLRTNLDVQRGEPVR